MSQTMQRPVNRIRIGEHSEPTRRWLGADLVLLGLGAVAVAMLGPLVTGVIRYHVSAEAATQIVGGDAAALALVAPVSVAAGILVMRRRPAGPVLALGPAVYALYTYPQLALSVDVGRHPGNSEQFFPLFLALFVLAGAIAVQAWTAIRHLALPATPRRLDRTLGVFLLVVAAFVAFGLHLPTLLDALSDQPTGTEYLSDPIVFWIVKFMDLGIVVPAITVTGVGIVRGAGWARRAVYAAVGWFALLGSSVAGMAIAMQATGDPAASAANTLAFGVFAAVGLAVAVIVYRPLFVGRRNGTEGRATSPGAPHASLSAGERH